MISPERLDLMQRTWVVQMARYGVEPAAAYPPFDRLVALYSEPHRHYHNLEHIAEVLKVIGKLGDLASDAGALYLAAWYHDAVYDSRASDNEERSADLARAEFEPLGLPRDALDRVAAMIRATAHTEASDIDRDTAVLLDADLAILGADEKRYRRYSEAIRREYDWVEEHRYRAGRVRVLTSFLKRERLYRTDRMFAVGEEPARKNIQLEIETLQIVRAD